MSIVFPRWAIDVRRPNDMDATILAPVFVTHRYYQGITTHYAHEIVEARAESPRELVSLLRRMANHFNNVPHGDQDGATVLIGRRFAIEAEVPKEPKGRKRR